MDARDHMLEKLANRAGLPANFARMGPTAKLRAILELPEPELFIRRLRADELYFLLNDIGLEDAYDLLAYTSPEQRTMLLDLDTWSKDRFDIERFDRILDMMINNSRDLAVDVIKRMDIELLAFYIFSGCRVSIAGDESEEPYSHSFLSPDNVFEISCENSDRIPAIRRFIDLLYEVGIEFAHLVLHGGMRDTPSSLEETAFRFRDARLQDLGFSSDAERFAIWEPFDVQALVARLADNVGTPQEDVGPTLALVVARVDTGLFLFDALSGLKSHELVTFMHRLTFLVNRVLSTRTTALYQEGAWDSAARHAVALASVGLELVSKGDLDRATEIVKHAWPIELYRSGIEVLRPIHLVAKRVVADIGGSSRLDLFPEDIASAVRAALIFPPSMYEGLVREGSPIFREFMSLSEAHRMDETCRQALAVVAFGRRVLGYDPTRRDTGATFANVFATAWAHIVLSGEASLKPLTGQDVMALRIAAFHEGKLRPAIREQALRLADLATDPQRVSAFLERALDAVEQAIGGLALGFEPDIRFLGDVLLFRR